MRSVGWGGASTPGLVMVTGHGLVHWRTATQIRLGGSLGQARKGHSAGVGNPWTPWLVGASCRTSDSAWSSRTSLRVRVGPHALLKGPRLRLWATRAWVSLQAWGGMRLSLGPLLGSRVQLGLRLRILLGL